MEREKTILLVEDEVIIAVAQQMMLQRNGFRVIAAHSGEDSIRIIDANPDIDLVLMDINLGEGMDGTETAKIILAHYDIPVVFLSSHTNPDIVERTDGITSYGYIVKNSGETVTMASIKMAFRLHETRMNLQYKELAVRESESRLQEAQRMAKIGSWDLDLNTKQLSWSDEIFRIFEIDQELFGASYESFLGLIHPDDREYVNEAFNNSIKYKTPYNITHRLLMKDGRVKYVQEKCENYYDDNDKPGRSKGTIQDITERKLAEDKIQNLLSEKELLLKEVHHRVKNNMNTIFSLLMIQAESISSAGCNSAVHGNLLCRSVVQDAASRVQSMMLLYEKLYCSENYFELNARKFITQLVDEIISVFPPMVPLKKTVQIENITLSAKILSPIGIVINEWITNSMKYAFINRKSGEIKISVSQLGSKITLCYEDDGSGLPEKSSPEKSKTFGMQLIQLLTRQVNGQLYMMNKDGLKYTLEFEI